ncbi:MAG TPA: exodeoxyribonuclease VII large subunit [Burkholderiales bacterium]|nr:exodeoxyribonuclease VII large subunit [Burkholderiales bacterium]
MSDTAVDRPAARVYSVTELNTLARQVVEQCLPLIWVAGEISNFKRYDSGHCYFTLKDDSAQVDCVFFRMKAMMLDWKPENGMQVEVRACPTLYEARGKFQLNVEVMRRAGLGALFEAFERLKAKLEREGLFDPLRKRALPRYPSSIGVVTSPQAAALRDVLTTLRRRTPGIRVIIYPTPVQGEGAGERIAQAVMTASARAEVDVLIVCRGGGSIEDLWAYNHEGLARAIVACAMPVVSGVGHETDFTITDFVADARAPTPTAAAQLASSDQLELCDQLRQRQAELTRIVKRGLENRMQRLDYLSKCLVHPGERIAHQRQHLAHLANRLCGGWNRWAQAQRWMLHNRAGTLASAVPDMAKLERGRVELGRRLRESVHARLDGTTTHLAALEAHLKHLSPQHVLERGYSITMRGDEIVRDASELKPEDQLKVTFARGAAEAIVKRTDA